MKLFLKFSLSIPALLHVLIVCPETRTIVIASASKQKISAVQAAFNQKFPHDTIEYRWHKTVSNVPEQPVGYAVALCGARNRIACLHPELVDGADYIVSVENYIEQSLATGIWYDKAVVLCMHGAQEIVLVSQPTCVPEAYVHLAQQVSEHVSSAGCSVTVGSAIQQSLQDKIVDPSDWHREPEFGGVSRKALIQDTIEKILHANELEFLKSLITLHPDFPKPGILFEDYFPIINNPKAFALTIDLLAARYATKDIGAIVGLESRGFVLGAALAYKLGLGFVPVRKPGKLPGATHAVTYQKEYGTDTLVISQNSLQPGQRVIIIDDLIATGGSARAAIELVKLAGGHPVEFVTLLKVDSLQEMARLSIPSFNLID